MGSCKTEGLSHNIPTRKLSLDVGVNDAEASRGSSEFVCTTSVDDSIGKAGSTFVQTSTGALYAPSIKRGSRRKMYMMTICELEVVFNPQIL